ncbi:protein transport protein HofC [Pantoea sp. A4]|uniref:protein transport protein HofC n=1 Tax=Pantoea sp. A4 TaxID=1225184 RepID=UPI00035D5AC8|nr:protein transport protein HofC [Pantoea sp. A4]
MNRLALYHWQAADCRGALQCGTLLAATRHEVLQRLAGQDLLPVKLQRKKSWRKQEWQGVKRIDVMRQLATLLKAGLPLSQALTLLSEGEKHPGWQALLQDLRLRILAGMPFSEALRRWPTVFPPLYAALIETGELTGQLEHCCMQLAQQQLRQRELQLKVTKALRYPLFILLVALAVSCGMLLFVLPEFVAVYASFNAPLPAFTAAVLSLSTWLQQWGSALLLSLTCLSVGGLQLYRRSPRWQTGLHRLLLRMPLVGPLWRGSQLSQIYAILQLTQQSGLTLLTGLAAVEKTLTSLHWRDAISTLQKTLAEGNTLHHSMTSSALFTPLCHQLIRVGEEAGALDEMLNRLAHWHETQAAGLADNLAAALEPAMMVVIGVIVGALVIAMYLPVFGLGDVLH